MAYRTFGVNIDQKSIWNELQGGSAEKKRTRTFHLARNALEHGFSAVVVRLRDPVSFLFADFSQVRMIPVCRIRRDSDKGHFSLFLQTDGESQTVSLHDPLYGPNRSVPLTEFLELWTPRGANDEITRNVAVLLARSRNVTATCPICEETFYLDPLRSFVGIALETIFCPFCDKDSTNDVLAFIRFDGTVPMLPV